MNITIVSSANGILSDLASAQETFSKKYPNLIELNLFDVDKTISEDKMSEIKKAFEKSETILLDLRLCSDQVLTSISNLLKGLSHQPDCLSFTFPDKNLIPYFSFGGIKFKEMMSFIKMSQFKGNFFALSNAFMAKRFLSVVPDEHKNSMRSLIKLVEYWTYANEAHMVSVLATLARMTSSQLEKEIAEPQAPQITSQPAIYDFEGNNTYDSLEVFASNQTFSNSKPTISVMYLGYNFKASQVQSVEKIIKRLKRIANVVPIFVPGVSGMPAERLENLLMSNTVKSDLIINFVPFRIGSGPMGGNSEEIMQLIKSLNIPILHPFFMTDTKISDWKTSIRGVESSEYLVNIMLPELDGAIDSIPVGGIEIGENSQGYGFIEKKLVLIEDRVEKLISRAENLLKLQSLKNEEKKVAILCYNYPPGEGTIFGGSFLDTFASVENIMGHLHEAGYKTPQVTKRELMNTFKAGKMVNSGRWTQEFSEEMIRYPAEDYLNYIEDKNFYPEMVEQVGPAPGETMVESDEFIIPGKIYDSVFVGLQPSKSIDGDEIDALHDQSLYPHHQYVAYYTWLKEEFKADVIVHVGTHGTLEFLKGKEMAMSGDCTPDELIGDVPHLYLYYVGNPSEAMIAKRRTLATIVSYQTPSYETGDLYDEYVELEDLLTDYEDVLNVNSSRKEDLHGLIVEKSAALNFDSSSIHQIEIELYRMKQSLIPSGLHVFGKGYSDSEAKNFLKHCLRYDREGAPSIKRLIAQSQGMDYDAIIEENDTKAMEKLTVMETELFDVFFEENKVSEAIIENNDENKFCLDVLNKGMVAYHASRKTKEMTNLLAGLNGEYIEAKLASDIVKSPEILPTGTNLYQFDPRRIPENTAVSRGKVIAENTIKMYMSENKKYPVSTGVVLWGFETSRTQGETIGQILHYLGVKVVPAKFGFKNNFEIIPLEELKRPRIDVLVHMTGFFRDIFPSVLEQLNDVIQRVAHLDEAEEDNYVRANYKRLYDVLIKEGRSEKEADILAASRIFGPKEGAYSTRVTDIISGGQWEEEKELAEGYMQDIQYVYAPGYRGEAVYSLLQNQLQAVDIVSQIRSNLEYEITDIDHYYEFFGGFQKAVEEERGIKVPVLISDTTGVDVLTENVKHSIERGVRTRVLNPKWIDALMKHEYHGTHQLLERFENLIGLAATTNEVSSWVFSDLNKTFVEDEKRKEQLQNDNPWAYHQMLERLFESNQRGYWDATEEEMEKLKETYLEIEGSIEEKI